MKPSRIATVQLWTTAHLGELEGLRQAHLRMAERIRTAERELAAAQQVLDTIQGGATWVVARSLRKPLDFAAPVDSNGRELLKGLVQWSQRRLHRPR